MIDESAIIDSIELYEIKIPLKEPFQISGGVSYFRSSLIVILNSGHIKAYGEAAPFDEPYYSSETISSVKALYHDLLFKRIVGKKIKSIEDINDILSLGVRGNNFAKAGIENAYWDLICRKNNITMKELIIYKLKQMKVEDRFLQSKGYIESGVSVGIPVDNSIDTLKKWIREYLEQGYRRIKIKVKPGWDVEALKAAREVTGEFPLWIDANSSFDFDTHSELFSQMDKYRCLFYEQPLHHDDILDHAKLCKLVRTPICLDESLKSLKVAKQVLEVKASNIWNIKIQRIGGLLEGLKIYKLAVENDIKLWGGTMPESGIGAIPILTLASFEGFKFPADVEASERWYGADNDLIELHMSKDGKIVVPLSVGIENMINKYNFEKYGRLIEKVS
ncbi:o-succinylbenzoate synthase [Clostridium swellfunianum]|uniref:o-succinylbenzoate synthase n=1 Tax=Clostridium swellfunianum TaxID=1367462 RepID=UPI0020303442|nr:o-succinylbenzoate synthase [Clostridium swellfunianum]MCM0650900.1 o-succinylbenzoate synthase [Clostridium swellfunianum]